MPMRRLAIWSAVVVCVAVLVAGCGDDVSIREAPRSVEYFSRSRDFMNSAIVLLNDSRTLWGQSIRSFYYAVFTVARAKDLDGLLRDDSSIHDKVWSQTVKGARNFFGQTVRRMRNRWDYEVREEELPDVDEDVTVLLSESRRGSPDEASRRLASERRGFFPHPCPALPASAILQFRFTPPVESTGRWRTISGTRRSMRGQSL